MKYNVRPTTNFGRELKRLAKKYPEIKDDIKSFAEDIEDNVKLSDPLGKDCYKSRMQITGKNSGKSGGARIIVNFKVTDSDVWLLSIYDKADIDTITPKRLKELLKEK